jgi:RNA polymerase sigma factor (sigma-70 family)
MAVTETGHNAAREIDDLYRAHVAEVYRYAYAVLGNHADAEDVTQTTFLNAYRALERGVKPRKPSNWLLAIASNAIKQRFRQEKSRPRQIELDDRIARAEPDDEDGPSVGELLTALSKIPPQQRQAIVLREFEGRSYAEIAEILGITTSALETLLFRARRSLAEELEHQLTCTEAQLAVSRSVDGRLGRKERRRLRDHLVECPDCARFARMQQRHRSALRVLALVPIPLSLTLAKSLEGTASAAVVPIAAGTGAGAVAVGAGVGTGATAAGTTGGVLAGGIGMKAAAVLAAAGVAGGVGVVGSSEVDKKPTKSNRPAAVEKQGARVGQVAPRGASVPGNGVARGKPSSPGQMKTKTKTAGSEQRTGARAKVAPGHENNAAKRTAMAERKAAAAAERQAAAAERRAARDAKRAQKPEKRQKQKPEKPQKPQKAQSAPASKAKQAGTKKPPPPQATRAHGAPEKKAKAAASGEGGKGAEKAGGPKG